MPGDRLTLGERRVIESAIAEGLGYTEIGRRLDRPTSTISREVHRNGGHNRYRALQAHTRAGHRAHRQRPLTPAATSTQDDPDPVDAALGTARERLVSMISGAGMPPMMAMILVALMLSERGAATAGELVTQLRVSPASISKAVRGLEHLSFVRREPLPGTRRQRYVLDEDMWAGIWVARTDAMRQWGNTVSEAATLLGADTPAGARLDQMSRFLTFLHDEMANATHRWRQLGASKATPEAEPPR